MLKQKELVLAIVIGVTLLTSSCFLLNQLSPSHQIHDVKVAAVDETSYSNLQDIKTTHFHLDIQLDFTQNQINGTQTLYMTVEKDGLKRVDLDIDAIKIISIKEETQGLLKFKINTPQNVVTGEQLSIFLNSPTKKNQKLIFYIDYSVQNSSASSWLTPEQTASKTLPYLYTQCESTYCRSLAPLQDSPYIKSTYSANVIVQDPINVFLSANLTQKVPHPTLQNYTIYSFSMDIPIPSYLFTIVAGNVVLQTLGERTGVISEPTYIQKYAQELSDLELYLTTIENYTIPYIWGKYQIVILPPSFPFGGMENPLVTFASPSIIVGDKSGVSVAIHEIAHSWTGNLVTCENWRNVWINEGLTVYLERQGDLILYGEDSYQINSIVGNNTLMDDLNDLGIKSNYTSLHPFVKGTNPDDSFNNVPYEKGFQFLAYLETLVGKPFLQEFIRSYLRKFQFQSVNHIQFREHFTEYVIENNQRKAARILSKIDWNAWINGVGLPPVILNFTTPIVPQTDALAQNYINLNGTSSPDNFEFFQTLSLNAKTLFLQYLYDHIQDLNISIIERIDNDYNLSNSTNMELLWRWFRITIATGYNQNYDQIHAFLGSIGRLKMITPVYQALVQNNQTQLAQQYFEEYKNFYHPIAVIGIQKIIGLSEQS